MSHLESYRLAEILKTSFTEEILSGSCVEQVALCLFGANTVTNIVKKSLPNISSCSPMNAILSSYIETVVRGRHKTAFS
jgi:hypothetical protein